MRTETITKEIYTFDELSDEAKEKARDWYRDGALDYDWWNVVYEDAERIAEIIGIEFDRKQGRNIKGETINTGPKIWFSGFSSQGDGASWEGDYSYSKGASKRIREHAPKDETLRQIADDLQQLQRRYFYQLSARVTQSGSYVHSHTMHVNVTDNRLDYWHDGIGANDESTLLDLMQEFADWIYSCLESEYEYIMSDENIDNSIRANEYEFDQDGEAA